MSPSTWGAVLLGTGLAGLLVGNVFAAPAVALAAVAAAFLGDLLLSSAPSRRRDAFARLGLSSSARLLIRQLLLLAALVTEPGVGGLEILAALAAVAAICFGTTVYQRILLSLSLRSAEQVGWYNLDVPGGVPPEAFREPIPQALGGNGVLLIAWSEGFLIVGTAASVMVGTPWWLLAGAGITAALSGGAVFAALIRWRTKPEGVPRDALDAAIQRVAPEVAVYFSSPETGTYALSVWLSVIQSFRKPVVIILREPWHLAALRDSSLPVLILPRAVDVDAFRIPSLRVVLYPANVIKNNHMVRIDGLLHCFIGHGDSDKAGSYSPVTRMYDEIWVAGQGGVERYLSAAEGFRAEQLRIVGRPQLSSLVRAAPLDPQELHVLYAPTWEGYFDGADYSSLEVMGKAIVLGLLDAGATVSFKPHPATGTRSSRATEARMAVTELLSRSSGHHEILDEHDDVYAAFNRADVLVTDVSSLITDFLATRKPYVVTNPRNNPEEQFRRDFPSVAGSYLLDRECSALAPLLVEIATGDSLRADRERLSDYLIGPGDEPVARFLDEVDSSVARSEASERERRSISAAFVRSNPS